MSEVPRNCFTLVAQYYLISEGSWYRSQPDDCHCLGGKLYEVSYFSKWGVR
jgi:hypothetical protein